jgi:hypothetical protein
MYALDFNQIAYNGYESRYGLLQIGKYKFMRD